MFNSELESKNVQSFGNPVEECGRNCRSNNRCCSFGYTNDGQCRLFSGCNNPNALQQIGQYRTCTLGSRVRPCPVTYYYQNGDINGNGFQQYFLANIEACAEKCNALGIRECRSIEWSPSRKICNLFKKFDVDRPPFKDFYTCTMPRPKGRSWSG